MLSDAYWHLDSGILVERAVSLLCDVRLNRDYTSKIMQAISLSDTPTPLLLQYLRTAKPMSTEPDDMDTYVLALAEDSLISAWQYQRTFPENGEIRTRLTRKVLEWCFSPKPRPKHLKQLIHFPLLPFEESLLHSFALDPPVSFAVSSIPVLQDLVCVRLIQSGQYLEAIKLDRQFASTRRGTQAPQIADRRRKMIEDVVAALPSIERLEIEEKLRVVSQRKPEVLPKPPPTKAPADLSMSWEEIPPITRVPPSTSAAPRFVLGRNTYGHHQLEVVTSFPKEVPLVQPVRPLLASANTQGAGSAAQPGFNGISDAQNPVPPLSLPSSLGGPKVGLFGSGFPASKSSGSASHRSTLFPPTSSQEPRHSTNGQPVLRSHQTNPPEQPRAGESNVPNSHADPGSDDEHQQDYPARANEPAPAAEFSESVFTVSRPTPSFTQGRPRSRCFLEHFAWIVKGLGRTRIHLRIPHLHHLHGRGPQKHGKLRGHQFQAASAR
ncbi:nuclear pore complex assembly-domain-containing protein [Multifurca ochricompacta]|uniref:Nuclear pore complex assembly-domain-containing protein n=1 Tax=Multifurca ochricompacta TaxID=376703 RepID=A0AAD4M3V9_9AGAM|nr:nuclear pore complex assembly-domain-containing protein [Multifurca ochricompacta]